METRIVLRREVQYLFSSDFKKLEIKRSVNVDLAAMNKTIVPPPRKPEHGILHPTAKHDIPPSLYKQSISSHILSTSKSHALHESNPQPPNPTIAMSSLAQMVSLFVLIPKSPPPCCWSFFSSIKLFQPDFALFLQYFVVDRDIVEGKLKFLFMTSS